MRFLAFKHLQGGVGRGQATQFSHVKIVIINTPTAGHYIMDKFMQVIGASDKTADYIKEHIQSEYQISYDSIFKPSIPSSWSEDIMVIHEKEDKQVSINTLDYTKKLLPKAKYITTEGLGHTRILKNQAVANKCSEWFKKKKLTYTDKYLNNVNFSSYEQIF